MSYIGTNKTLSRRTAPRQFIIYLSVGVTINRSTTSRLHMSVLPDFSVHLRSRNVVLRVETLETEESRTERSLGTPLSDENLFPGLLLRIYFHFECHKEIPTKFIPIDN